MIPATAITAWEKTRPWPNRPAIEQDLLLARTVVAIYGHPLLARELVFRGGTCLHHVFRYSPAAFAGVPVEVFRAALRAEGIPANPTYGAVYTTALWGPGARERWRVASGAVAENVNAEAVVLNQHVLLGTETDMADIAAAIGKVQTHATALVGQAVTPEAPASVQAPRH